MWQSEALVSSLQVLVKGLQVLGIPILPTEQNPAKLGPTIPEIKDLISDFSPVSKLAFSCCREPAFMTRLEALGRPQVLLTGIEAHVCVCQTALDLVARGYQVQLVTDGIASRTKANRKVALQRMKQAGVVPTSVEMVLFELLQVAEGERFKEISRLVK